MCVYEHNIVCVCARVCVCVCARVCVHACARGYETNSCYFIEIR